MDRTLIDLLVWLAALVFIAIVFVAARRGRRSGPGAGSVGTVYDWLNEEKRNAVELIVEDRAAARDPEDKDGNLPDCDRRHR